MSERQTVRVRDGQKRLRRTNPGEVFTRGVVKLQLRRPAAPDDFEVTPEHAERVPSADRLHPRFLRGKSPGQMRRRVLAPHAVGNLFVGEDPTEKPVAVSFERLGDAGNLGGIHPQADDRHDPYSTMPAMLPAVGDDFEWVAASWGHMLRARALAHVPHGWTTRQLVLRGSSDEERDGWDAIAHTAGLSLLGLVRLRQVHGAEVHIADAARPSSLPAADIVLTDRADRVVAVQVADCAPVLVAADHGRVVAAAHAGWRGTAADVAGVTVRALERHLPGTSPQDLSAAIGPSIGPCCYEVGDELVDAFNAHGWSEEDRARWFSRRGERLYLDVWQANADQLVKAGVPPARVHVSRLCTACHLDWFYSYRREGAGTGRLAGFIRPRRLPA